MDFKKFIIIFLVYLVSYSNVFSKISDKDKRSKEVEQILNNIAQSSESLSSHVKEAKDSFKDVKEKLAEAKKELDNLPDIPKNSEKKEKLAAKIIALQIADQLGIAVLDSCDSTGKQLESVSKELAKN